MSFEPFEQAAGEAFGTGARGHADARSSRPVVELVAIPGAADGFEMWRIGLRRAVLANVAEFVAAQCAAGLAAAGVEVAGDILMDFVNGGKCVYVNSYESSTIWRVEADSGYISVHTVVGLQPPAGILTTSVP